MSRLAWCLKRVADSTFFLHFSSSIFPLHLPNSGSSAWLYLTTILFVCFPLDPTQPDVELSRKLGTMLCRGPNVASISPLDGYVQLEKSPFEE